MARITEKELILPSLYLLNKQEDKTLTTTDLIDKLRDLLKPDDEDLVIISGRNDDKFSQKVRNLKSHNTLTRSQFCSYQDNQFTLTNIGEEYLIQNVHLLNAILPLEDYYIEFKESILNIQQLSNVDCIGTTLINHYFGMLYSSVITSLETYLYDAIRFKIDNNIQFLENFVKTFEKYQKEKKPPRFIIVTDYETLLATDTKTEETLDIELLDIAKHYDFFLPWAGVERAQHVDENPADVKAAEKMAKLYDEIVKKNEPKTKEEVHALNVFLTRLLFCYFAEDSNIFEDNQFTNAISHHTQVDGSDLDIYLERLFDVLNIEKRDDSLPEYLKKFPYVNGGLFKTKFSLPKFTMKARNIMVEVGGLDWSQINPDIFGSMMQAVITEEHRGGLGIHYTSVPNIMKVIEPLFLDELYEAFENAKTSKTKLQSLLDRLANLKIFDPACGSGNFLIIAYKELRTLEIKILKQINKLSNMKQGELFESNQRHEQLSFLSFSSGIELTQFYGIELDNFAHEIAILSLWLTEHQMNIQFYKEFGQTAPPLPLPEGGHIVHGNATRIDWKEVCPKEEGDEIYLLGNPPYIGGKSQTKEQKEDMKYVFDGVKNFKELDYIACWFLLASKYIDHGMKFSFVTTSSVSEGAQVEQLWPLVLNDNHIFFAYKPFNWTNNAKGKAGVTCSIVGVEKKSKKTKYLFDKSHKLKVDNINGYLVHARDIYIGKKNKSISSLPTMITGNSPYEGGNLMLSFSEKELLLEEYPEANMLIKKTYGANEFIKGLDRWCLWIEDSMLDFAMSIPPIKKRIEAIQELRKNGGEVARGLAERPHQFRYTHVGKTSIVIVPIVSSSRREYIPMGILPKDTIILSSAAAIYDTEIYVFGVISSRMHMQWVKLTAGKLRGDIRYLSALSYNTFPFPNITQKQKDTITEHVFSILEEREKYSEKTLAQLYDPGKMAEGLRQAHHNLDLAIEQCYRKKPFKSDEERLEYLFGLYEKMVKENG